MYDNGMHNDDDHPNYEFFCCDYCGTVGSFDVTLECDCEESVTDMPDGSPSYQCCDFYSGYCPVCRRNCSMNPVVGLSWG